ncbi:hypothetical protein RUR49_05200 [Pseudoxanthobacter sp. M-2]|uniref:hypothetical protein n=1 Tax=Pseudoxanthobacter sp. M-2 TaxID=3078754 RepID=UPI0038FC740D
MNDLEKARRRRDSAFSLELDDVERDGKIQEMISLPDGLYTVSERAIYRTQLADMIDPDLAHPNTPHVNQRFASAGSDNPIVGRTFLQAHRLFSKPHFDEEKRCLVMTAVLAGMQEILGAEDILTKLQADLLAAEKDLPSPHKGAMALPAVGDIEARGKAFVQRSEHALQAIFRLAVIFYGDTRKPGFFDGIAAHVRETFGEDENFVAFADSMARFAKLIRGLRHSIEHRKPNQKIDFLDYHFEGGQLLRPTVRITHPDVPFNAMPLNEFLRFIVKNLIESLEALIVYLAASNVSYFGKMPIAVGEHPHFGQGHVMVKYTYLIGIGDPPEWHPLG